MALDKLVVIYKCNPQRIVANLLLFFVLFFIMLDDRYIRTTVSAAHVLGGDIREI